MVIGLVFSGLYGYSVGDDINDNCVNQSLKYWFMFSVGVIISIVSMVVVLFLFGGNKDKIIKLSDIQTGNTKLKQENIDLKNENTNLENEMKILFKYIKDDVPSQQPRPLSNVNYGKLPDRIVDDPTSFKHTDEYTKKILMNARLQELSQNNI